MFPRILLFCALICSILFTSCDAEGLAINKDFSGATITLAIPPSDAPGTVTIKEENVETNLRQSLADFDIEEDRLRQVAIKTVTARIKDPSGNFDFSNLKDITLKFYSETLGDAVLATLDQGQGTEATFEISDAELKEYLLSDRFDAVLNGTSDQGIGENVSAEIDITYEITAGL